MLIHVTVTVKKISTSGEALVLGSWRTSEDLRMMSHDDERNTLITEMTHITSESVEWLQSKTDNDLINFASVAIYLRDANIRRTEELAKMSADDQRNTLITQLHYWTDVPVGDLQAQSNKELVVKGYGFMGTL